MAKIVQSVTATYSKGGGHTTFHWKHDQISDRLLVAVGAVVLEWAKIDNRIIDITRRFWMHYRLDEIIPRSFDARRKRLKQFGKTLYENEPEEYLYFSWFLTRLSDANGFRDDICHGIPGTVTKRGRNFECLQISHPSKETRHTPVSIGKIERFRKKLSDLDVEASDVSWAVSQALTASLRNTSVWQDDDNHRGWILITPENRSPMLPKSVLPPPSFRP